MLRVLSCRGREYSLTVGRSISRVLTVYSMGKSPGPAGHIAAKQHASLHTYDRMHRTHHSPCNVQLARSLRCSISSQQRSLVAASTSRSAAHGVAARPPGRSSPSCTSLTVLPVPPYVRTCVRAPPAALRCTALQIGFPPVSATALEQYRAPLAALSSAALGLCGAPVSRDYTACRRSRAGAAASAQL